MSPSAPALELYLAEALGVLEPDETVERSDLSQDQAELARAVLMSLRLEAEPVPEGSWEALSAELKTSAAAPRPKVTLSCTFCHDSLVRRAAVYCATCLAPHHEACFGEHGRCCILGCEETQVVRAGALDPPITREPPRRRPKVWVAAALTLALAGGVAALVSPSTWFVADHGLPVESVHPTVAKTYVGGSTVLEVTWGTADRPVKPANVEWENLSGEPADERLHASDDVAQVEWVLPRLERSLFLVRGVGEGTTSFKVYYPTSNRLVTYPVEVSGADPHLLARDARRADFRDNKSPRELALKMKASFHAGEVFTKGRTLPHKESYYRKGYEAVGEALDAAQALAASEDRRGGRTQTTTDWVMKCQQAEARALEGWEDRLALELARYRALAADASTAKRDQREQLRSVLRLIGRPCDARFRRFEIILREAYGSELLEREACVHEGR